MTYKMGDAFGVAFECRTTDQMVAVADNGRVYTIAVSDLPSARGDGLPVNSFIDLEREQTSSVTAWLNLMIVW